MLHITESLIKSTAIDMRYSADSIERMIYYESIPKQFEVARDLALHLGTTALEYWPEDSDHHLDYHLYPAARLDSIMRRRNVNLYDIMECTGMSYAEAYNVTTGRSEPRYDYKKSLAEMLRVNITDIWPDEEITPLRIMMYDRNMTCSELSELTGIKKVTLFAYINGNCKPSIDNARQIAKALDSTIEECFYGED